MYMTLSRDTFSVLHAVLAQTISDDTWLRTRLVLIERGGTGGVRPDALTRKDMMITNLKVGWHQILGVFCKIARIKFSLSTPVPQPLHHCEILIDILSKLKLFSTEHQHQFWCDKGLPFDFFPLQGLRVEFVWKPTVGIPRMRMWEKIRAGNHCNFWIAFQYL